VGRGSRHRVFQCSSASRKFLNRNATTLPLPERGFSALQRAENSSIELLVGTHVPEPDVSVLFSEPKIPQSLARPYETTPAGVSVLFSEPKIPQ